MTYRYESEMYPEVQRWFYTFLSNRFRKAKIEVHDTSKKVLSKFLVENRLHKYFPEYQTYEIEADIVGFIKEGPRVNLAFVECKLKPITLRDLSQLLGYSKVAKPLISVIISPGGFSDGINFLFNVHRRDDILNYYEERLVYAAKWLAKRCDIDYSNIIPKGSPL